MQVAVKSKPTLKSIADAVKLSPATISRILNGKGKEINLSDETINRVQAFACKAGYRPHRQARSLRMGRTDVIGVCMALPPTSNSDLIYRLFKGISSAVMRHNKTMMVLDLFDDGIDGLTALKQLEQCNVDGIIASHRSDKAYLKKLDAMIAAGQKVVMVIDHEGERNCPRVDLDHSAGVRKAIDYLLGKGCRRIAHMGIESKISVGSRIMISWERELRNHGLYAPELFVSSREEFDYPGVKQLLLLPEPPDAIFCWSDKCALQARKDLAAAGREDIRIVGFDNREFLHFIEKPFATVDYPLDKIGQLAVETLLGDDMTKCEILVDPELIIYD